MEGQRYSGAVKSFRGSFGWVACPEVAEKYGGRDTFLHKNSVNAVPVVGCRVNFRLVLDAKGNPKADEATLEVAAEAAPAEAKVAAAPALQRAPVPVGLAAAAGPPRGPDVRRAALMLTRGEEVLVMREDKEGRLRWSDLGGKVEAGEALLECALRELAEEAEGFLSPEALALLDRGMRQRFGSSGAGSRPELVTLRAGTGEQPHAVAVFLMDCKGVDIEPLSRERPNSHGVHELRWMSRADPALRDRHQTRWPLLRALCALRRPQGVRSRSRSPRRGGAADGGVDEEEEEPDGETSELEEAGEEGEAS
eukprot:CAMPEP_0179055640 /NCGR_PEP_ID=MMETSP0796-20121207/23405_1 /TAXON_ID=73915 /ORGANISM="Pyrodinium bahamense, Strain pbaha01" /LENGTH=308 /DNA_ID=CAMNT_0020752299 /DNA_START=30 /DNA_END=956 /DNA_ORIENTATION=-